MPLIFAWHRIAITIFFGSLLSGCLLHAAREIQMPKSSLNIAGEYLTGSNEILRVFSLRPGVYQYKEEAPNPPSSAEYLKTLEARIASIEEIITNSLEPAIREAKSKSPIPKEEMEVLLAMREANNQAVGILHKEKQEIEAGTRTPTQPKANNIVFQAASLGGGWFIAQIANVIYYNADFFSSAPEKYDITIGSLSDSSLKIYFFPSSCQEKEFAAKAGAPFADVNSRRALSQTATYDNLRDLALACINSGALNKAEKETFARLH